MTRLPLVLVALAVALVGCEEGLLEPPEIDARYTLWGAFDPAADRQAVRVVPVTDTVGLGSADPLPATVTSLNLETGTETVWEDSVVVFQNGSIGHIYRADLQPEYGSRHVFRVTDDEGETSALVSVPPLVQPIRQPPVVGSGVLYPVLWIDAPQLNRARVTFLVEGSGCSLYEASRTLTPNRVRPVEFGWQAVVPFDELAADLLRESLDRNPTRPGEIRKLSVREMTLSVEVASEDWRPPGGVFDPEVLVEPGTLSNVTRGFGFVGASYPVEVTWSPTPDELRRTILEQNRFDCTAAG